MLTVTPETFQATVDSVVKDVPVQPSFMETLTEPNAYYFERSVTPSIRVEPERLEFLVKLNNHLDHVIRGAGTVVAMTINGKQVTLPQEDYIDLLNATVIPRGEMQVKINGPIINNPLGSSLSSGLGSQGNAQVTSTGSVALKSPLSDSGTIAVFFYDFVTATDAAGNPTEKHNFEWYWTYKNDGRSQSGVVRRTRMVRR